MTETERIYAGKTLYLHKGNSLLHYSHFSFYLNGRKVASPTVIWQRRVQSENRAMERMLRLEPRCIERLGEDLFALSWQHRIWLLNTATGVLREIASNREGWSAPLNLCTADGYVYWGDYGGNQNKEKVCIYRMNAAGNITTAYTFPAGTIRHIHNLVWDSTACCFYVFTGDLEPTSGIYRATQDWSEVVPVATGSQQYRAVVGFSTPQGLLYATDAVNASNHIYLIRTDGKSCSQQTGELLAQILAPFPGSCINGCETRDYYIFSSTVEPPEGRGLLNMFDYRLGAGIVNRYAHLVTVRKSDLYVEERLKLRKDILPMKLFQYGAITFPKGQEDAESLLYNVTACRGDGHSFIMPLE